MTRLGIAGLGLIGGSIARRARAQGVEVIAFDRDASALAFGRERGFIDRAAPDLIGLAAACETLVIALPADATKSALEALSGPRGPALVIDVASIKAALVKAGSGVQNYIGTHPMAGREQGGIAAADGALFEGATWAYSPHADAVLVERVRTFIASMGAGALEIDPIRHDEIVALTSHLPQALSVLLGAGLAAAAIDDECVLPLCGPGMLSMLRLARSPESVWAPIIAANAPPLAIRMRALARALDDAAATLEAGDEAPLLSYFANARAAANDLEKRFPSTARSSTYRSSPINPPAPPPTR